MIWELTWEDIMTIVKIADNLLDEYEPSDENFSSEEVYYNKVLEAYKQTKQYMSHFSIQSCSFESTFNPDLFIDIPDLDKIQEVAMKKADEKYAPSFTYNDYAQDYDDINVGSRAAYEEGFFDGGKYMFDILNGTKVALNEETK